MAGVRDGLPFCRAGPHAPLGHPGRFATVAAPALVARSNHAGRPLDDSQCSPLVGEQTRRGIAAGSQRSRRPTLDVLTKRANDSHADDGQSNERSHQQRDRRGHHARVGRLRPRQVARALSPPNDSELSGPGRLRAATIPRQARLFAVPGSPARSPQPDRWRLADARDRARRNASHSRLALFRRQRPLRSRGGGGALSRDGSGRSGRALNRMARCNATGNGPAGRSPRTRSEARIQGVISAGRAPFCKTSGFRFGGLSNPRRTPGATRQPP